MISAVMRSLETTQEKRRHVWYIGDMAYGILAQKDEKLSSVVRALKEIEAAEKSSIPKRIFL